MLVGTVPEMEGEERGRWGETWQGGRRAGLEGIEYEREATQGTDRPWQHLPNQSSHGPNALTHTDNMGSWTNGEKVKKSRHVQQAGL